MARAQSHRRIGLIVAGLLIASLAIGLWLTWPHERDLLSMSQPIVALDRTAPRYEEPHESAYWLSDSQLLIITTDHIAEPNGKVGLDDWKGHAEIYSLASRKSTRLIGLSRLLNRLGVTPMGAPISFELSPNGTRLSWQNHQHLDRLSYLWAIANLDGSGYRECEWLESQTTFWIDDRHFAEALYGRNSDVAEVHVLDGQNPKADRYYPPSSHEAKAILHRYRQSIPTTVVVELIRGGRSHYSIEIKRYQDGERLPGATILTAPMPKNALPVVAEPSGQNSTILYDLRFETIPPLMGWLHRILPRIPATPRITEGLWVSRVDGTGMREIGHVSGANDRCLEDIEWLPDGKHISFVYRGMLYTVPTERPR